MTYKESQAQKEIPPDLKGRKPNEPIAWIASLDSYQSRTARMTYKESQAQKEIPPDLKGRKPNELIAWIASSDSFVSDTHFLRVRHM